MNQAIMDALKQSLPEMQMTLLTAELQKARRVDELEERIKQKESVITRLDQELSEAKGKIHYEAGLKDREEAIKKERLDLDLKLMKKDVECAQKL